MKLAPTTASTTRRDNRAIALATLVGLALLAPGCGASGTATSGSSASAPARTSTSTADVAPSSFSAGSSGTSGTTPPGTKLALGAPALVDYKPGSEPHSPTYRLQVTVASIERGSKAEMAGV
jgi:hypothetical protein